jgi:hypothetical protein
MNRLLNRRADGSFVVCKINQVYTVNRAFYRKFSYLSDLFIFQHALSVERRTSGFSEPYSSPLVPYLIDRSQVLHQHQHVQWVDCTVDASSENSSDIIASPPVEWEFNAYLTKIFGDEFDVHSGSPIAGPEVVEPSEYTGL